MPTTRHFLNWTRPALAATVDHLLRDLPSDADEADLSRHRLALLSGRASRRLLELLVATCEARKLRLIPPKLMTVSHLAEHLHAPTAAIATPLARRLLFADAVRSIPTATLQAIAPTPPAEQDAAGWAALAQMVERLHNELAAARLRFADVPPLADEALPDFADHDRFTALAAIQDAYFEQLDALNLEDPHRARLRALDAGTCSCDDPITLVAVNYLPPVVRAMLEQSGADVTALVHAPAERADAFDAFGCLDAAAWADAPIPLRDDQIEVVQRPADQAAAVLRGLQSLNGKYPADHITVGLCDESITPALQQHLPAYDVPVRDAAGTPLSRTGPYRLLAAVADYLERQRFGDFAALLRHPDLPPPTPPTLPDESEAFDGSQPSAPPDITTWLPLLDRYFNEHLQGRVSAYWLGNSDLRDQLKQIYTSLHSPDMLGPLATGKRPLNEWAEPILQLLRTTYAAAPLSRENPAQRLTIEACQRLHDTLTELHDLPFPDQQSEINNQQSPASEAIRTVLRQLTADAIPPEPHSAAVELLGPLELHLDDAPVLLITGVNEGKLPESVNADAFLPNALRAAVGLEDNARRYARDAYALTAILHSRPHVRLIAGRRDAAGNPLAPSRLLFADTPAVIADRVARFYSDDQPAPPPPPPAPRALQPAAASRFILPPPLPTPRISFDHMAVTEFKRYLACPYRYYLQRALRLQAVDDAAAELDAMNFGSLAHDVLQQFGESPAAHATDSLTIADTLRELLHELVRQRFGSAPLPAVRVQVKQLENRLHHFAERQADWAQQGWRIQHVELNVKDPAAALEVDGDPMPLRGRIDRIDQHESTGQLALLDYKTGDNPQSPEATHRTGTAKNKTWCDLQLPLYRHLLVATNQQTEISHQQSPQLGYILLPRDTRATAFSLADWQDHELEEADETAREVVRQIRAGNFNHDPTKTPPRFDPFAEICGTGQLLNDNDNETHDPDT